MKLILGRCKGSEKHVNSLLIYQQFPEFSRASFALPYHHSSFVTRHSSFVTRHSSGLAILAVMASLNASIEEALAAALGKTVAIRSFRSIGGGCINRAQRMETDAGVFFIKTNSATRFPGMFAAEAKGLALLRQAGALGVPAVVACGEGQGQSFIIMEFIHAAARTRLFWENFGRALARLHRHRAVRFGLDHDNYIGSLPQSNTRHDTWHSFFIEERLRKQSRPARDAGLLSSVHIRQLESLYPRLAGFFPAEAPALLHGDLWSGNFMTDNRGEACLIDPAVYYGHREAELAFTRLFGGFDVRFYDAYHEAFPLHHGWEERMDMYNLYPLLVHVNLFGGGYVAEVVNILNKYRAQ